MLPRRKAARLRGYDYTQPGMYFVTVCTHSRRSVLGEVNGEEVRLTPVGLIVFEAWSSIPSHFSTVDIDTFVVMPNHIHGVLFLRDTVGAKHASPLQRISKGTVASSLSAVVQSFKSASSRLANRRYPDSDRPFWQRGFFERIVRDDAELCRIRRYIEENPSRWAEDEYYRTNG
jgi:REP element-mobilizing transposase RayT